MTTSRWLHSFVKGVSDMDIDKLSKEDRATYDALSQGGKERFRQLMAGPAGDLRVALVSAGREAKSRLIEAMCASLVPYNNLTALAMLELAVEMLANEKLHMSSDTAIRSLERLPTLYKAARGIISTEEAIALFSESAAKVEV